MLGRRASIQDLLLAFAYFVAASVMIATTRFDQGVAFIWVATAVLVPALSQRPRDTWLVPLVGCGVASALATGLFGLGWALAIPLAAVNMLEAYLAARLLDRRTNLIGHFEDLGALMRFLLTVGLAAPLVASVAAGLVLAGSGRDFFQTAFNFYVGHALGAVTFIPIVGLIISGEFVRTVRQSSFHQTIETILVLALVAATLLVVFWVYRLPLLFLPAGPIVLAIFRARQIGAAVSIILFALIGGIATARGHGPIQALDASVGAKMQFFQLCLAAYVVAALSIAADLKYRSRLHRELRRSKERYQMLAEHSSDILLHLDKGGRVLYASPAIERIGGYDSDGLVGRLSSELIHPHDIERVSEEHRAALRSTGKTRSFDYRGLTRAGKIRWFETRTRAIVERDGEPGGVLSVIRDISSRKQKEDQLSEAALTDSLTGIANRRAFREASDRLAADKSLKMVSLALIDLDYFKSINDRLGHAAGDEILKGFAAAAAARLREQDFLARIGGEEFAILFPGMSAKAAAKVCDRLRESIAKHAMEKGIGPVALTFSGGVAEVGPAGIEEAMSRADTALYRAKDEGRNRIEMAG
jgi:diguanylate cyclase (GGDEF)-like protein/PAS domain S-box-containing protein